MLQPQFKPHSIQQVLLRLFQVLYIINSSFHRCPASEASHSLPYTPVQRRGRGVEVKGGGHQLLPAPPHLPFNVSVYEICFCFFICALRFLPPSPLRSHPPPPPRGAKGAHDFFMGCLMKHEYIPVLRAGRVFPTCSQLQTQILFVHCCVFLNFPNPVGSHAVPHVTWNQLLTCADIVQTPPKLRQKSHDPTSD